MPSKGKKYGNASQVTVHIDDYGSGMKGAKGYRGGGMAYADGGYADGDSVKKQNKPKAPKAGNKKPASTADAIKNTRARQMKELGL